MEGDTRPASFAQAFSANPVSDSSAAAPQAAEPSREPSAVSTEAATTAPSATTGTPDAVTTTPAPQTTPQGEPPKERWESILQNAREKSKAEVEQQYGWAKQIADAGVKPEQVHEMFSWYQQAGSDPVGFAQTLVTELLADARFAPQMRSHAARILGTRPSQPQVAEAATLEPDIPVADESGRVVARTYSAERVKQIVADAVQEALAREVEPIKRDYEVTRREREQQRISAEVNALAGKELSKAEKLPHFKDYQTQITEVYGAHPEYSLQDAYLDVLQTTILPKLTQQQQSKVLDDLKSKAAAAALNPAQPAAPATKRPENFWQAFGVER